MANEWPDSLIRIFKAEGGNPEVGEMVLVDPAGGGLTFKRSTTGDRTVLVDTTLLWPNLTIEDGDTITVETGAFLQVIGTLTINGTGELVLEGTGECLVIP